MINLTWKKINLVFKKAAGTSRGILLSKPSWVLILVDDNQPNRHFHGEVSIIPGLSYDDSDKIEVLLNEICEKVNENQEIDQVIDFTYFPAVEFGYEILKKDYSSSEEKILFKSDFTEGNLNIPINGLIWMGDKKTLYDQIKNKLDNGWKCIKLKIGGIDFQEELELLRYIRSQYDHSELEIRLDANGAFNPEYALEQLKLLSEFNIHSIEQPVKQGHPDVMSDLCWFSPIPIALDEELIGIRNFREKKRILKAISPQYIIIKPSLIGGFRQAEDWIELAKSMDIGFWVTSALESNIGLNAIAQWTASLNTKTTHGLGTGMLYTNNFNSPLTIIGSSLAYDRRKGWEIDLE